MKTTVTLRTNMLAGLMGMAMLADERNLLPETEYQRWLFQFKAEMMVGSDEFDKQLGLKDFDEMGKAIELYLRTLKERKRNEKLEKEFFEKLEKERKEGRKMTTEYNHPQRYTGEDGKDLIDRMEEGLITEDQTRGFLKGNILKYVTRYEDKGGMDDLIKANEYLRRLIAFEDGGDNND